MPNSIRLSELADADLESIALFSIERFGLAQARRYRDDLLAAIASLLDHPMMGVDQAHIATGLRRIVHASHAIYYSNHADSILVERILGAGQDPVREFPAND